MNKFYLTAFAMATLFAGCSKADDPTQAASNNATENNSEELVEIQLGVSTSHDIQVETRAIYDLKDQWTVGDKIGVYALPNYIDGMDWTSTTDSQIKLLDNVDGTIAAVHTDADGSFNGITFGAGSTYYYPKTGTYNYSFYGYYPKSDNTSASISSAQSDYEVKVEGSSFVGDVDIMAGYATTTDGYNRTWAKATANANKHPHIEFLHQTTALNFYIKKGEGWSDTNQCKIKSIKMGDIPTTYTLLIAKCSETAASATTKSFPSIEWGATTASVTIAENNNGLTPDETTFQGNIFINARGTDATNITIEYMDGTTSELQISPLTSGITSLEKGKKYDITLTIVAPQEIKVDATIKAWEQGGSASIDA